MQNEAESFLNEMMTFIFKLVFFLFRGTKNSLGNVGVKSNMVQGIMIFLKICHSLTIINTFLYDPNFISWRDFNPI